MLLVVAAKRDPAPVDLARLYPRLPAYAPRVTASRQINAFGTACDNVRARPQQGYSLA